MFSFGANSQQRVQVSITFGEGKNIKTCTHHNYFITTNSSCLLSSSKKGHDWIITRNTKIHVFTIWPSVWFDANSTSSHKYLLQTRTNRWQKRRRGSLPCVFPSSHRAFPLTSTAGFLNHFATWAIDLGFLRFPCIPRAFPLVSGFLMFSNEFLIGSRGFLNNIFYAFLVCDTTRISFALNSTFPFLFIPGVFLPFSVLCLKFFFWPSPVFYHRWISDREVATNVWKNCN